MKFKNNKKKSYSEHGNINARVSVLGHSDSRAQSQ